jgi:diguanylate cyclase (GGDEF)-like protein/PAS domain S-box-containing protein
MADDNCRCLFCRAVQAAPVHLPSGAWAVQCAVCGAQGPATGDSESARSAWTTTLHGEELLRTVIDESPDVILMKDWDGRFLLGNVALARLYGTTPDALVGVDDGAFNPNAEQVAFYLENVRSVMRGMETEIVMESSTDVETGEIRHFQSIKKPLIGPDGQPRILVIAHDITDLQRAHQAIEARERSYSYAMAAAGEGIWDWDLRTNLVTHNAKWGELFGFAPEELSHPIEVFAALLHDDDREDVQRALRDALTGSGTYQHEHRMRHRDGSVFHVFDRGEVVERDEVGNPTRMAGAVSDITDRVHAEHRLRVTTEALIDANISLERKVEERTAELERANENLRNLAWRDALTGLPNRLAGMDRLESEFARLTRGDGASSVLMLDVDLFKPINDTYGHGAGDDVLRHIASLIKSSLRTGDFVARFGGEEFMALLPDTDLDGARTVAEKIRETIQDNPEATVGTVTISIGVTLACAADAVMDVAVRRADAALYEAKRSGRNRVVVSARPSD